MSKTDRPRVCIALLAYNQGRYVDEMIESLRRQSFQDFEVILADDGSNDGFTPQKLRALEYDKISKKIIDCKNIGNAERRKQLYRLIRNDYIVDLSADDILDPCFLEQTVNFLNNHSEYGAVSTNYRLFKNDIDDYYYEGKYDKRKMDLKNELARNCILGSSLMRNRALMSADLSGDFVRYQDWDRWISMLEKGWKIGLVEKPLFYYRQVSNSLSHSASIEDELKIRKRLLRKHRESYEKYYEDVIINMEYAFLEVKEGKDWLDEEYHRLIANNTILKNEIDVLRRNNMKINDDLVEFRNSKIARGWLKIKRMCRLK